MTSSFKTVALFGKQPSEAVAQTLLEIRQFLTMRGFTVLFEPGDVQASGRTELAPHGVPLVGINFGRLGFITDIPLLRWPEALGAVLDGHFVAENRSILKARVSRDSQVIFESSAVNDVVISRSSRAGMIDVQVHVDGIYMYSQRADGLIVATPTGSTAYALSCNGPILHPSLEGIVLVPVAPQALSNRPIVLPATSVISMSVAEGRETRVNCDMQTFADLQLGDLLEVSRASYTCRFLHPSGYSYYATLRSKLNWHEMPSLAPRL